jgi:hypothetical protein
MRPRTLHKPPNRGHARQRSPPRGHGHDRDRRSPTHGRWIPAGLRIQRHRGQSQRHHRHGEAEKHCGHGQQPRH